ncbi:hypothetical protein FALBO_5980 [Fusarium albosuccineum]|uniref:LysM domain-containing protein n=1 Tax=Fusarium albosuccineum TaxID=1237068 RepID=A0A8H4LGM0_9HYPO|nr:hypothetical protein FALBO_5980 [Fusarium albosuccineum]
MKILIVTAFAYLAQAVYLIDVGIWQPESGQTFDLVMRELRISEEDIKELNPGRNIDKIYPSLTYNVPYLVPRHGGEWTQDVPPRLIIHEDVEDAGSSISGRQPDEEILPTSGDGPVEEFTFSTTSDMTGISNTATGSYLFHSTSFVGVDSSNVPTSTLAVTEEAPTGEDEGEGGRAETPSGARTEPSLDTSTKAEPHADETATDKTSEQSTRTPQSTATTDLGSATAPGSAEATGISIIASITTDAETSATSHQPSVLESTTGSSRSVSEETSTTSVDVPSDTTDTTILTSTTSGETTRQTGVSDRKSTESSGDLAIPPSTEEKSTRPDSTLVDLDTATTKEPSTVYATEDPMATNQSASQSETTNVEIASKQADTTATMDSSTFYATDSMTTLITSRVENAKVQTYTTVGAKQSWLPSPTCIDGKEEGLEGYENNPESRLVSMIEAWCSRFKAKDASDYIIGIGDPCVYGNDPDSYGLRYGFSTCWIPGCVGDEQSVPQPLKFDDLDCETIFHQVIWKTCKTKNRGAGGILQAGCLSYQLRVGAAE